MWFRKLITEQRLKRKTKLISDEERQEILKKSPLETGAFQGEGFHVFLKNEPDFQKAYVTSLGEISNQEAEDWIIRQYLLNNPDT